MTEAQPRRDPCQQVLAPQVVLQAGMVVFDPAVERLARLVEDGVDAGSLNRRLLRIDDGPPRYSG